jgi:outer membrane lipoprotein-sorting protein
MVSLRPDLAEIMKRIVAFICLLFVFASFAAEEKDLLLNRFLDSQKTVKTWTAELVQTRTSKSFSKPLTAPGRVWFSAPNRFHWELGQPAKTMAVRNADQMLVIYPKLKRVEKYPLNAEAAGQWKDMMALLDAGFPQDRKELESRFTIASVRSINEVAEIVLEPKAATARKMMPRFTIGFSTRDLSLLSTEMEFADGSTMRNDFHAAKINETLDPTLFTPDIPGDYKVVEPLKK